MSYDLNRDDLQQHLQEQLGFLQRSADAFDEGHEAEAKRMAHVIRILVHDTGSSHSLLGQLEMKAGQWVDTCLEDRPGNLSTHGGLVAQMLGQRSVRWTALLDDGPFRGTKNFDAWWNAPVFRDNADTTLSRRDLILTMANKDGGSHVDPKLTDAYARLVKENSLGFIWMQDGVEAPATGPEKAAVRQLAHEVLRSLKPGYAKARVPGKDDGVLAMGMSIVEGVPDWAKNPNIPVDLPEDPTRMRRALAGRKTGKRQKRRARQRQERLR